MNIDSLKESQMHFKKFLLPSCCFFCKAQLCERSLLCDPCYLKLSWIENFCIFCSDFWEGDQTNFCPTCRKKNIFSEVFCLFRYAHPIDKKILKMKLGKDLFCARFFGDLMAEKLLSKNLLENSVDAIIPVPTHSSRLRKRGFNQALEIAKPLSQKLGIPLMWDACKKIKETHSQTKLDIVGRRKNLRNAFSVEKNLSGKTVVIVDDVLTTGSTAQILAETLRKHGVRKIHLWICAKTL